LSLSSELGAVRPSISPGDRDRSQLCDGLREVGVWLRRNGGKESALSAAYATKAWRLRDRVSDRERFYIDFVYDRQVTGNLEKGVTKRSSCGVKPIPGEQRRSAMPRICSAE